MKKNLKFKISNFKFHFIAIPLLLIVFSVFVARTIRTSVFLKNKDRVNVVFYGKESQFYSLDRTGELNYFISFYPDLKVTVPGGYGQYRLGALTKLVNLEKKPEMIRKTFSFMSSSFVDLYFYPKTTEIYFGKNNNTTIFFPKITNILSLKSNANLFDRIYLLTVFLRKSIIKFTQISDFAQDLDDDFKADQFAKDYQGNFYEKTYRKEGLNIQITYTNSYKTASSLSQIIEGEGIRVADINQEKNDGNCSLVISTKKTTETAKIMQSFFNCRLVIGDTGPYDIIFKLGNKEREWEIN